MRITLLINIRIQHSIFAASVYNMRSILCHAEDIIKSMTRAACHDKEIS